MNIFKRKKKEEIKTPIMFDGHASKMYMENCDAYSKIVIGLMDYLGEEFTDLLLNRYDCKITPELMDAIKERNERNKKII